MSFFTACVQFQMYSDDDPATPEEILKSENLKLISGDERFEESRCKKLGQLNIPPREMKTISPKIAAVRKFKEANVIVNKGQKMVGGINGEGPVEMFFYYFCKQDGT